MKKFLIAVAVCTSFMMGYGIVGNAIAGIGGLAEHHGYFDNRLDDEGTYVFPQSYVNSGHREAIPASVNTASEFISFIEGKLNSGNAQEKTGAAFIIQTMIGESRDRTPNASAISEWKSRVNYAEANGLINWRRNNYPYTINSYYQGTGSGANPNDDAFYTPDESADAITFRDKNSSTIRYALKWECANPVGTLSALNDAGPDFDVTGYSKVDNKNPKPGDDIIFTHFMGNDGPTSTAPTLIRWTTRGWTSDNPTHVPIRFLLTVGILLKMEPRQLHAATETYHVPIGTPAGTVICREIGWTPDTESTGTQWGTQDCATVQYDYKLEPSVTVSNNVVEPGDTIRFTYNIKNRGTTRSNNTACTTNGSSQVGYFSTPGSMTDVRDPVTCGNIEPGPNLHEVGHKDIIAVANTTYCRSLTVNPASPTDGSVTSVPACAVVATKPYVKVYGGDVSVGGDLETAPGSCDRDDDAGIIAWNKRDVAGAGWSGAGTQYAAMAVKTINDFATTQMGGGSAAPSSLAFSNSDINPADQAAGLFGKGLGRGVSCMPDYYANDNATSLRNAATNVTAASIDFNSSTTGTLVYKKTGGTNFTLNTSSIKVNQKVILYVEGDLRITGSGVTYQDNWSVTSAPLFQVVVRGNIYIDPSVSRLDGMYVAQAINGTIHTGEIYTCTDNSPTGNPFTPMTLDGNLLNKCDDTKLVVNGSMVADRLVLLRTAATVSSSTTNEPLGSNSAAEVFNFSPVNWITQPVVPGVAADEYDSITSLPPIL